MDRIEGAPEQPNPFFVSPFFNFQIPLYLENPKSELIGILEHWNVGILEYRA